MIMKIFIYLTAEKNSVSFRADKVFKFKDELIKQIQTL